MRPDQKLGSKSYKELYCLNSLKLSHYGGADGGFNHAISALLNINHRNKIDDSLDVFIDPGFGGGMGTLLVAILAPPNFGACAMPMLIQWQHKIPSSLWTSLWR